MRNAHSNELEAPYGSNEPKQINQHGLRAKLPLYNDVMTEDGLMLLTNEEIKEIFGPFKVELTNVPLDGQKIYISTAGAHYSSYNKLIEEYKQYIEEKSHDVKQM
jgi:hypothetical protein